MKLSEVSGAVRPLKWSLGVKGLICIRNCKFLTVFLKRSSTSDHKLEGHYNFEICCCYKTNFLRRNI